MFGPLRGMGGTNDEQGILARILGMNPGSPMPSGPQVPQPTGTPAPIATPQQPIAPAMTGGAAPMTNIAPRGPIAKMMGQK